MLPYVRILPDSAREFQRAHAGGTRLPLLPAPTRPALLRETNTDTLRAFVRSCCYLSDGIRSLMAPVYRAHFAFFLAVGVAPFSFAGFREAFTAAGFTLEGAAWQGVGLMSPAPTIEELGEEMHGHAWPVCEVCADVRSLKVQVLTSGPRRVLRCENAGDTLLTAACLEGLRGRLYLHGGELVFCPAGKAVR